MEAVKNFFKNDRFAEHVGIELLEVSEGRAKAKMEIKEHHLNGIDIAHGGAIFSLADPKLATYEVRVTDETDDIIAIFLGTVYRKKDKI